MFILSSSECRNIHPCTHIYISVYNPRCLCMAECGSPGHVRKPQGWQKPVTDKWSPKETQRWPLQLQSHSQKKGRCAPGARGHCPPRAAPITPAQPGVPWGTPGCCGVARATPTSLSPQELLALSLHACHPLIPAALAQMGGNPTLEEIREPEIAAFRITKRK